MGRKLTDKEKRERKLKREETRNWRRKLCVDLCNDAIKGNDELDPTRQGDYLSPAFLELIRKYIK